MPDKINPIRPTDPQAIALAKSLIADARFGALAVIDPTTGHPHVTRIALASTDTRIPLGLISDLSHHTTALRQNPHASLLIGEPKRKGDPLTYPRLTLSCSAEFIAKDSADYKTLRDHYLTQNPTAKLYINFADFNLVLFHPTAADLNGGFGKAYRLTPAEILLG